MNKFWRWDYFGEYIAFLSSFVVVVGSLTFFNLWLLHSKLLTVSIGFMALMTEATLGMPQLYHNWKSHSRGGLRYGVFSWLDTDVIRAAWS